MLASDSYQSKSLRDLSMEAGWFVLHAAVAVLCVGLILAAGALLHASPDRVQPKLIGMAAAFLFPLAVGFAIARVFRNEIARHVWIAGLLLFAAACVWVLDLPTGAGLCEHCGAVEKLWRTFFDITHGSGLMGGNGLMVAVWIPLALFSYAMGAGLALENGGREDSTPR